MIRTWVAPALAGALFIMCGTARATPAEDEAGQLRKLDIMLMVTALRCRNTPDDFLADYGRFTSSHLAELNAAATELRADYALRFGAGGGDRALDRLSTQIANLFGEGHPWLDCAQLGQVARNLSDVRGTAPLVAAADQLLSPSASSQWAYTGR